MLDPTEIRGLLLVKHFELRDIAKLCGVDPSTVSYIVHGGLKGTGEKGKIVRKKIADILQMDEAWIWDK